MHVRQFASRPLRLCLAGLTSMLVLAACGLSGDGGGGEAGDKEPFRVLAILPMSSAVGPIQKLYVNGLKIAAEELNTAGGIDGRRVEIAVEDDKFDPTKAASILTKAVNSSERPDLVIAGGTSNESLALTPITTREKILSVTGAAAQPLADTAKSPYNFIINVTGAQAMGSMADHLASEGYKDVAIAASNDALGTAELDAFKAAAPDAGINVIDEVFDPTATDLTSPLAKLQAKDPDVLVLAAYGSSPGYLLEARAKRNWDIVTVGELAFASSNVTTLVDESALNNVFVQGVSLDAHPESGTDAPVVADFIEQLKGIGKIGGVLHNGAAMYDFLMSINRAAEAAGSTDPDDLVKGLEDKPNTKSLTYGNFGYTAGFHGIATDKKTFSYTPVAPLDDTGRYGAAH